MTIDKLPSGSYRIRHTEKGKTYSLTVPFKPSKKEAYALIAEKISGKSHKNMTFEEAADQYLKVKSNVLSPSTQREYASLSRCIPEWFNALDLSEIDRFACQKVVNEYAVNHAPKTVSNYSGFVQAVLKLFYPDMHISVTLPQKVRKKPYTPSEEDVKRLLEYSKNTKYYIPFYLASLSLRVSEICALTLNDLDGNSITISKALVKGDNGYVLKPTPKTDASYRTITIPQELADSIRAQGCIYEGYPGMIRKTLIKYLKHLGIPYFSVHKLRHFFASYTHDLGYSDAIIQSVGGWNSDVMKRTYRHALNEDEARQSIADNFSFL